MLAPENCSIDSVWGRRISGDSEVDPPDKLPFFSLGQQRVSEVPLELLYVICNRCLTGSHENWLVGKHCFAIRFYCLFLRARLIAPNLRAILEVP